MEYVKGIPLLKAFSESKKFDEELEAATSRFGESSKCASKNKAAVLSRYGLLVDLAFWAMAAVGIVLVFTGSLPPITYLVFIVISREFYKPFVAMEGHWAHYISVTDSFRRIQKITEAPTVSEPVHPQKPQDYGVSFEDVSFFYEEGEFAMEDITFQTPEHTLTALVGESGSGKTTVTNLLLRFWDVKSGSVRIGNVDVRDMSYDDLLGSISIVMQNVQLFADTIENNILIGKANATKAEVIEAAKKARIHDFILSLPDGYETKIWENGVGLSGGQKQRISIARAFLKDAPVLLLDEVTSNVDPVNEALIQEAISELAQNRTVLVVAHHLSTVRSAGQILVFKNGRIVQSGTHESLLQDKNGYYKTLWNGGVNTQMTGIVHVMGVDTQESTVGELGEVVGSVFQDPRSQFFMTNTTDEVAFDCLNMGISHGEVFRRINTSFTGLKMDDLKNRDLFSISSGQKQKVAIASCYAMQPEIYVFDEPSANLDLH